MEKKKPKFIVGQLVYLKTNWSMCIVIGQKLNEKKPFQYFLAKYPSGEHLGWFTASKLTNILSTSEVLTGHLCKKPYN